MRITQAALALTTVALLLTACASQDRTADHASFPDASKPVIKDKGLTPRGGTVYLLSDSDFTSLDPADNDATDSEVVGRLIYRTLTFIKDTPGEQAEIKPDLAEELGKSEDGGRTWTYKIRRGLQYEDGAPITARDIKYGVERTFARDVYKLGATYLVDRLVNSDNYAGPYIDPTKDLSSIETPDDFTMVFHFAGPQPDADWMMSLPYTAPIPPAADTRSDYANRPVSSGPYKVANYARNHSLTLVRNDRWDAVRDANRPAYPNRFEFTFGNDRANVSERLLRDQGADKNAAAPNWALKNIDPQRVQDNASVRARLITNKDACVDSIVLNTQKIVDPQVRHAIAVAIDRASLSKLYGGDAFGTPTDSILSPTLPGYGPADLGLKSNGDPQSAKQLLLGKSIPALHYLARHGSDPDLAAGKQIAATLKRIGIDLSVDAATSNQVFDSAIVGDDAPAVSTFGWCYDWPTPSAVVPPLLGPDASGKTFNQTNPSRYYDPTMSSEIQQQQSNSTENATTIASRYNDIANRVQTSAWPMLPFRSEVVSLVLGSNLSNAGISQIFGEVDLNSVAVKS